MHVEIGYRKICHLVNCIQLVTMRLSSNLRTGLSKYKQTKNTLVIISFSKTPVATVFKFGYQLYLKQLLNNGG